jgi:hypothetical protein
MTIAKNLSQYGGALFPVQHKSRWTIPPSFDLMISVIGVKFLKSDTKEQIRSFGWDQLKRWTYTTSTIYLEVEKATPTSIEREITLQTIQVQQP